MTTITTDEQRQIAAKTLARLEDEIRKEQAVGVPADVIATIAVRIAKVRREIHEYDQAHPA